MPEHIRKAGIRHVDEISANNRDLVEKALYMRCQSFLAHVKAQLLTSTIYEVDGQRRKLKQSNTRLADALAELEAKQVRLTEEIARRELLECDLTHQRELASILHRGLSLYLRSGELEAALDLVLGEVRRLLGAAFVLLCEVDEAGGGWIRRVHVDEPSEGGEARPAPDAAELALEPGALARIFGPVAAIERGAAGPGGRVRLAPGLPESGQALLLRIDDERLVVCVLGGLAASALEADLELLDPFASSLGALLLAARLRERERHQAGLLLAARVEADQANRSKSDFLANMSHEIRTPLNVITGTCHLLAESGVGAELGVHVRRIGEAGETLIDLIDDILDLSKVEAGELSLERAPFEVRPMIARARGLAESKVEGKDIALVVEVAEELADRRIGDRVRIQQVLTNLLDNAIKFTERGSVTLRVSGGSGAIVRFDVEDTGIGIGSDELGRIFGAFTQADASITRRFGGTGLGLAISRRLVELMGGSIEATSAPGRGSVFTCTVRIEVDPEDGGADEGAPVDVRGLEVLAVDDSPLNQLVIEAILAQHGARPTVVSGGVEALERVAGGARFDAILMDIQMPEMDGYETTRRLRRLPGGADVPIFAMTARVLREDHERALAAGMNDHLGKPIDVDRLLRALSRWTRGS